MRLASARAWCCWPFWMKSCTSRWQRAFTPGRFMEPAFKGVHLVLVDGLASVRREQHVHQLAHVCVCLMKRLLLLVLFLSTNLGGMLRVAAAHALLRACPSPSSPPPPPGLRAAELRAAELLPQDLLGEQFLPGAAPHGQTPGSRRHRPWPPNARPLTDLPRSPRRSSTCGSERGGGDGARER